jgi:hypothetical protein
VKLKDLKNISKQNVDNTMYPIVIGKQKLFNPIYAETLNRKTLFYSTFIFGGL